MDIVVPLRRLLSVALVHVVVCLVILSPAPNPVLAAAVEVDADSSHRAVWKIHVKRGAYGTAFAIGERLFLTCAHVIRKFYAGKVILDQHGSEHGRRLSIDRGHVTLAAAQDIALVETREKVNHYLTLADTSSTEPETKLRIMGHPEGRPLEILRNTDPIGFRDEIHFAVAANGLTRGGSSGSPVLRDDGKVVGMHCHGSGNMFHAVKVEQLRRFLGGEMATTSCRKDPSLKVCSRRAVTQMHEIAGAGDPVAQYQLHLTWKDLPMLLQSAEAGLANAQHKAGLKYTDLAEERFGGGEDAQARIYWADAAKWYRRSAEQGYPLAKTDLAALLYRGDGVFRDLGRAFRLLLEAAKAGDHQAHFKLGEMYRDGHGTTRDETKARHSFQNAIDRGNRNRAPSALHRLSTTRAMRVVEPAVIRDRPGTNYRKKFPLKAGQWVRVLHKTGDWFKLPPALGWQNRFVHASKLAEPGPGEAAPIDPESSPPSGRKSAPDP